MLPHRHNDYCNRLNNSIPVLLRTDKNHTGLAAKSTWYICSYVYSRLLLIYYALPTCNTKMMINDELKQTCYILLFHLIWRVAPSLLVDLTSWIHPGCEMKILFIANNDIIMLIANNWTCWSHDDINTPDDIIIVIKIDIHFNLTQQANTPLPSHGSLIADPPPRNQKKRRWDGWPANDICTSSI